MKIVISMTAPEMRAKKIKAGDCRLGADNHVQAIVARGQSNVLAREHFASSRLLSAVWRGLLNLVGIGSQPLDGSGRLIITDCVSIPSYVPSGSPDSTFHSAARLCIINEFAVILSLLTRASDLRAHPLLRVLRPSFLASRLILLSGTIFALSQMIAPASAQNEAYRFKVGDLIEVWVAQQQTLNRQIVVRPDGAISMPLAGHLQAVGLTPEELETTLKQRLQQYFNGNLDLTIMLGPAPEQEAPMIYITGDVDQPGIYRFRSGMTVLHAVSAAGGFFRPDAESDRDRAIEQESSQRQLESLLLQEARLQSELRDRETIELPPELAANQGQALKENLLREQALLDSRRQKYRNQQEAAERLRETAQRQVSAVATQVVTTDNQFDLMSKRYENIRSLVSKGIATDSRLLEIEISLEELKRTKSQLQADLTRAESNVIQYTAALPDIQNQRQIELQSEFQQTKRDLEAVRSRIEASRSRPVLPNDGTEARQYVILRSESGSVNEISATELTQIREGDLIRVDAVRGGAMIGSRPRREARRDRR